MTIENASEKIPEIVGIILALIIVFLIVLASKESAERSWATHTVEIQALLHDYESAVLAAESGQRGYLMSGNENYLDAYYPALAEIPTLAKKLSDITADNPKQIVEMQSLSQLTEKRLGFLARTLNAKKAGDVETVRQILTIHPGKTVMSQLRATVARMIANEKSLYEARTASAALSSHYKSITAALGSAVLIGALAYWAVTARRQRMDLRKSNVALQTALEQSRGAAEQIRQMQKLEAIGQLTGGIAHDFNNILAVIISGISLSRRRKGDPSADSYLQKALESAESAAKLIKKLMSFSRQQPLAPETIHANAIVSSMSEMVARMLGDAVQMETVLAAGLWTSFADPIELETSLLNLCINARDAMPEGGKLTVETANCHLDDPYTHEHPGVLSGQYVLIAVTDTGSGMDKAIVSQAFNPFFTTKPIGSGTGLGLSQVYGFVKQSGGHIKIYSEVGEGTTVKIYLPRMSEAVATRSTAIKATSVGGAETILVVEDNAHVLSLTADSLRDLGYTAHVALGAHEALRMIASDTGFDLLITDVVMPEMSGKEVSVIARKRFPALRVLYMTGFTKNAIVHNGTLDAGVHLLQKPFTFEELARTVRKALDGAGG